MYLYRLFKTPYSDTFCTINISFTIFYNKYLKFLLKKYSKIKSQNILSIVKAG